jgi:hypothetical protein
VDRWIHGWNGLVGEPPTDVTLGAKAPVGRALVTSGSWTSESDARILALMAANALEGASVLSSAERLVETALRDSEWSPATLVVDALPIAVVTRRFFSATVAYPVDFASGFVAAWRGDVVIRRLLAAGAGDYAVDPFAAHALDELDRQLTES